MLTTIILNFAAIFIFLFIFWKRLKEDYSSEIIFKTSLFIFTGIGIGLFLSFKLAQNWIFWITFAWGLIGMVFALLKLKIRFYETIEAFLLAILPWLSILYLIDSTNNSSLISFLIFIEILLLIFGSYFFDTHYRNFKWYKSGKIGFAGLVTAGIFFVIRFILAILGIPVLSFVVGFEAIISGVIAFVCFLLLYIRSK